MYTGDVLSDTAAAQPSLDEVVRRVRTALGWHVVGWTELGTGTNNRLFRLDLADGPPLLAKLYVRDRWPGSVPSTRRSRTWRSEE